MKNGLVIYLSLLMLLLPCPLVLAQSAPPGGQPSTGELEQMLEEQNQQILTFYEDAIAWAIEASNRYWAYFAGIALLMILFKK